MGFKTILIFTIKLIIRYSLHFDEVGLVLDDIGSDYPALYFPSDFGK